MSWLDSVASPQGKAVQRRGRRSSETSMQSAHDRSSIGETSEMSKGHIRAARKKAVERTRKRAADMHAQALHHENLARDKKNEMRNRSKVAIRAARAQEINALVLRYRTEQIQQEVGRLLATLGIHSSALQLTPLFLSLSLSHTHTHARTHPSLHFVISTAGYNFAAV